MNLYFSALRVDHILGFFRLWELPAHAVTRTALLLCCSHLPLSQIQRLLLVTDAASTVFTLP